MAGVGQSAGDLELQYVLFAVGDHAELPRSGRRNPPHILYSAGKLQRGWRFVRIFRRKL